MNLVTVALLIAGVSLRIKEGLIIMPITCDYVEPRV